ncbi:MAG: hypothetical protein AAF628_14595 [Planctomycetota bacterium]
MPHLPLTQTTRSLPIALSFLTTLAFATSRSPAQATGARALHPIADAAAYDSARQRVVLTSGNDVFEWDGAVWTYRPVAIRPDFDGQAGLAFDVARRQVVAWGRGLIRPSPTWTWDGQQWNTLWPRVSPSPRRYPAMAYDAARQRVVLFGGDSSATSPLNDTWEWDGTTWALRYTPTAPPCGGRGMMAYDPAGQRCVLLTNDETWTWDGSSWTNLGPAPVPRDVSVACDPERSRVVMVGRSTPELTTYEWDGVSWARAGHLVAPPDRTGDVLVFAGPGRGLMLIGGAVLGPLLTIEYRLADQWRWDGATWRRDPASGLGPAIPLTGSPLRVAYDAARGELMVTGGQVDPTAPTWLWNGSRWRSIPQGPARRSSHSLAYDPVREQIILYGGTVLGESFPRDDAWAWDGTAWQSLPPGPPARAEATMAFDPVRQRMVLYGGQGPGVLPGETWEWDGTTWLPLAPSTRPPLPVWAERTASMAFDRRSQTMVLHVMDQLWDWNGSDWSPRAVTVPPATESSNLAWNPHGYLRLVHAGKYPWDDSVGLWRRTSSALPTTFTLTTFPNTGAPPLHAVANVRGRDVVVGHSEHGGQLAVIPRGIITSLAPTIRTAGPGCAIVGPPSLHAYGRPYIGTPGFALDLEAAAQVPAAALVAAQPGQVVLPGGCAAWFDPATFLFSAAGTTNGFGFASFPLPIPPDPALTGSGLVVQSVAMQPGGPMPWVFSNALALAIGE